MDKISPSELECLIHDAMYGRVHARSQRINASTDNIVSHALYK